MSRDFGFVFVLHCPIMPGVYLLGWSHGSPHKVAEELSSSPAAPHDYEVAYYAEVEEPEVYLGRIEEMFSESRFSPDRSFFCSKLIDLITAIEGDGEAWSTWDSDMAVEARNPGQVDRRNPLWFEQPLHSPGYLERLRKGRE
ncbi:TPA: GIY-YIG nuclease family protein [Pseudomonas aeruginosa]